MRPGPSLAASGSTTGSKRSVGCRENALSTGGACAADSRMASSPAGHSSFTTAHRPGGSTGGSVPEPDDHSTEAAKRPGGPMATGCFVGIGAAEAAGGDDDRLGAPPRGSSPGGFSAGDSMAARTSANVFNSGCLASKAQAGAAPPAAAPRGAMVVLLLLLPLLPPAAAPGAAAAEAAGNADPVAPALDCSRGLLPPAAWRHSGVTAP